MIVLQRLRWVILSYNQRYRVRPQGGGAIAISEAGGDACLPVAKVKKQNSEDAKGLLKEKGRKGTGFPYGA